MRKAIPCLLFLVACSRSEPNVKKADTDVAASTAVALAPSASAPSAPAASASAPPAAPEPPASPEPTEKEWAAAQSITGDVKESISSHGVCEAKKVREWVRIACKGGEAYPWAGDPLGIRVEKGEKSVDKGQSHLSPAA